MSPGGVRTPVWLALGTSAAFFAAALAWDGGGEAAHPAEPPQPASARAPRPSLAPLPAESGAHSDPSERPGAPRRAQLGVTARDAEAQAPPPVAQVPDPRSGELVGLEREAGELALSAGLLDSESLDAAVAKLPRAPGESDRDFADRRNALRHRIASDELLVQHRLSELYEGTVYPVGFPVEQVVVPQERQLVVQLPPEDRAELLRRALEHREPSRAEPSFEAAESGLVWRGGTPGL